MGSLRSFSPPCHTPFVRGIHRARWGRVRGRNAHLGALRAFDPPCHTPFVRGIHRARWGRVRGRNAHAERAERWPLWGVRALCSFALRHFAPAPKKSGFYFSLPHLPKSSGYFWCQGLRSPFCLWVSLGVGGQSLRCHRFTSVRSPPSVTRRGGSLTRLARR